MPVSFRACLIGPAGKGLLLACEGVPSGADVISRTPTFSNPAAAAARTHSSAVTGSSVNWARITGGIAGRLLGEFCSFDYRPANFRRSNSIRDPAFAVCVRGSHHTFIGAAVKLDILAGHEARLRPAKK